MKLTVFCFLSAVCVGLCDTACSNENCGTNDVPEGNTTSSRVLSRRKRFLIFPDGSSLQLVFCCQTAAVIPIGDIFLFGNTAALAWNLPTDPELLLKLKEHDKLAQRRGDNMKHIYYVDENGKFVAKVPYKRPTIISPVFAKRSVDLPADEDSKMKINRKKMHETQKHFLKEHLDEKTIEFHRSSRVGLLEKIESLITALGGEGRLCVLRKLCETGKIVEQGTFLQEILRVVFTLPKGKEFEMEDHKEYDKAHSSSSDCAALYPCEDLGVPARKS